MELLDQLAKFLQDFPLEHEEFTSHRNQWENSQLEQDAQEIRKVLQEAYQWGIRWVQQYQNSRKFLDPAEVARYIEQHYLQSLALDSLAKLFLVTKEHLCRTFRQKYGMTILDFITKCRMEQAKNLLGQDDLPIKDIPVLCGYADLPYFYRVFKQYFGMTPAQVRQSLFQESGNGSSIEPTDEEPSI